MRLADGTSVCCLAAKKSFQAPRRSAEDRGAISGCSLVGHHPLASAFAAVLAGAGGELVAELGLAGAHGGAALGEGVAHVGPGTAGPAADVGRHALGHD